MVDTHHEPGGDGEVDGTNRERSLEQIIDATQSELARLWSAFGLSEEEQQQQQIVLSAVVEKACETRLHAWRREIDRVTTRVDELESEIRGIQRQFQRNEVNLLQYVDLVLVLVRFGIMEVKSAAWYVECLQQIRATGGTLRDRLATLEMEFKFLDSVRNNRVAEMRKLQAQLDRLDQKLGTDATFLPSGENDLPDLSDQHKEILQNLVQSKLLEVQMRRSSLLEAVGECVQLAQELQMKSDQIFDAELDARLKIKQNKELGVDMIEQVSQRIVQLREMKTQREARLAEMLGQIQELWDQLEVPKQERERFQQTYHGVGKAALASCEAGLARLQRQRRRCTALNAQIAALREAIVVHWDLLGYSLEAREYFSAMMHTPTLQASCKVLRAHEKQLERLQRQWSGMRILHNYVTKREEIVQARAENAVPDAKTRAKIERELPKYTAILKERIAKWQEETGVPFQWKGQPYLEHMHAIDREYELEKRNAREAQQTVVQEARASRAPSGRLESRLRLQTRHSIEERGPRRSSSMESQLARRRSESQTPQRKPPRFTGLREFFRDPAAVFTNRGRPST